MALIAEEAKRQFVVAPDALAAANGIVPGQTLADARALAGDLAVSVFDPTAVTRELEGIAQLARNDRFHDRPPPATDLPQPKRIQPQRPSSGYSVIASRVPT